MHFRAMDCRKIYGFVTFLLIWVPMVSAQCRFQQAQMTLHKIQIIYDQFKTDMLNQTYIPKPSPEARFCGHMKPGSLDSKDFHNALVDCSERVQTGLQREWHALRVYHDKKCNHGSSGVSHLLSTMFLPLFVWIAVSLPQ